MKISEDGFMVVVVKSLKKLYGFCSVSGLIGVCVSLLIFFININNVRILSKFG